MKPLQDAKAGYPLRAADLNAQSSELQRIGKISVSNGSVNHEATGVFITAESKAGFYARISGRSGYRYGFQEFIGNINSGAYYGYSSYLYSQGPRKSIGTIDYAEELNGNLLVPDNTIVFLEPIISFTENNKTGTKYGFTYYQGGADSATQSVIVNISSDANGVLLTKHNFAAYNSNTVYSPTLMACTDVIPKSLSGQKNRVLVVNASETGFEFGGSVAPSTGIATATAQIAGLTSLVNSMQSQINSINGILDGFYDQLALINNALK